MALQHQKVIRPPGCCRKKSLRVGSLRSCPGPKMADNQASRRQLSAGVLIWPDLTRNPPIRGAKQNAAIKIKIP